MLSLDITVAVMYLLAVIVTRRLAFVMFLPALLMSNVLAASPLVEWLSTDKNSPEFIYYLAQSMIWLLPPMLLRNSPRLALCSLSMCIYEWLVSVESFIWQYVTPVETPLHSEYAFLVVAIHLVNLSSATKWGGEIGYLNWPFSHRSRSMANL